MFRRKQNTGKTGLWGALNRLFGKGHEKSASTWRMKRCKKCLKGKGKVTWDPDVIWKVLSGRGHGNGAFGETLKLINRLTTKTKKRRKKRKTKQNKQHYIAGMSKKDYIAGKGINGKMQDRGTNNKAPWHIYNLK